jgi:hypothetical protein
MKFRETSALFAMLALCAMILSAPAIAQDGPEAAAIRQLLVETFDKPEAPLMVDPIVVADGVAIAGWSQNDLGGRALLRRTEGAWTIILCGGDALKQSATLESVGIAKPKAEALAANLSAAEAELSPARLALFSRFDGLVGVDAAGDHTSADPHHMRKP